MLIGASRKRFLGRLLAAPDGTPRQFVASDDATVSVTALAAVAGAGCARVHRVRQRRRGAGGEAWRQAARPSPPTPARQTPARRTPARRT